MSIQKYDFIAEIAKNDKEIAALLTKKLKKTPQKSIKKSTTIVIKLKDMSNSQSKKKGLFKRRRTLLNLP